MMSLRCGSLQTAKPVNRSTRCWDIIAKLAGQYTACVIPGAKLSVYEGIGHPRYQDAPRINAELAAFERAVGNTD
jgi:hypothetical protein